MLLEINFQAKFVRKVWCSSAFPWRNTILRQWVLWLVKSSSLNFKVSIRRSFSIWNSNFLKRFSQIKGETVKFFPFCLSFLLYEIFRCDVGSVQIQEHGKLLSAEDKPFSNFFRISFLRVQDGDQIYIRLLRDTWAHISARHAKFDKSFNFSSLKFLLPHYASNLCDFIPLETVLVLALFNIHVRMPPKGLLK